MIALVLGLFLLQAAPQGTGFVTGTVRSSTGSPAPGIRVYGITYRDAVESAKLPPALESLTETDASGRYRLELRPGRYHIATGSVASPTYYPGTVDIAAARVISVARDLVVPDIDFGTFVPASRTSNGISVPTGNGVLSGVIRHPDGTPASGITVVAVPNSTLGRTVSVMTPAASTPAAIGLPGTSLVMPVVIFVNALYSTSQVVTDARGAYRIENLAPDTYNIVAGYAEAPVFYPGVPDATLALGQIVAMNSKIDKLDFAVPRPTPGVAVSGSISTTSGIPATGATVKIRPRDNPVPTSAVGLPLRNRPQTMNVSADGLFSFPDIQPGAFVVEISYSGVPYDKHEFVVSDQPVGGLQFVLPVTMLTGRILMEDGRPVPNPELFDEVILATTGNSKTPVSTLLPISAAGTFSRAMEADEFRFRVRGLPEEYEITSLKSGSADLLKETLKISGRELVEVEMRVARRSSESAAAQVSGSLRDSISGVPLSGRITLCCSDSGPAEKYSAPLAADGSFAFATLPAGKYVPALQQAGGNTGLYIVSTGIEVGVQGLRGAALFTATQFGQVTATIRSDGPDALPEDLAPSVVFVNPVSGFHVDADRNPAGDYVAMLPLGAKYDLKVEQLPQGFVVKFQPGPIETPTNAMPNVQYRSVPLTVTIGRVDSPRP